MKRFVSILLFVGVSLFVIWFAAIVIQGHLPANKRSKYAFLRATFKAIQTDVNEYVAQNKGTFPRTWSEMGGIWNGEIPQHVRDPFTSFQQNYRLVTNDDRMIVYSVGPNGKDDLVIAGGDISRKDEAILILKRDSKSIESEVIGIP